MDAVASLTTQRTPSAFRDYVMTPSYHITQKCSSEIAYVAKCILLDWPAQLGMLNPHLKPFHSLLGRVVDLAELQGAFLSFQSLLKVRNLAKGIFNYNFSTDKFPRKVACFIGSTIYTTGLLGSTYFGWSGLAHRTCNVAASFFGIYADTQYVYKRICKYSVCQGELDMISKDLAATPEQTAQAQAKVNRQFAKIIKGSASLAMNLLTFQATLITGALKSYGMLTLVTVWLISRLAIAALKPKESSTGGAMPGGAAPSGGGCCAH